MLSVTKSFEFCASHYLPKYLGPCQSLHGHNYILEVSIADTFTDKSNYFDGEYEGIIIDFSKLKQCVYLNVISVLDHKHLNNIENLSIPTAENIVLWIVDKLLPIFNDSLIKIRLYETQTSYAEWRQV